MDNYKLLDWLDEQESELMAPIKVSGRPATKYHLEKQEIINKIRSLINLKVITRAELDEQVDFLWHALDRKDAGLLARRLKYIFDIHGLIVEE